MKPIRYNVGDKVVITDACIERMKNSNRSCVTAGYPTDSFINKAMDCKGIVGEVTHTFPPGYEVTAQFPVGEGAQAFHMKDNWIEPLSPTPEQAARLKLFAECYGDNWKEELLNFWLNGKDAQLTDGHLLRQVRNQLGPRWLKTMSLEDL